MTRLAGSSPKGLSKGPSKGSLKRSLKGSPKGAKIALAVAASLLANEAEAQTIFMTAPDALQKIATKRADAPRALPAPIAAPRAAQARNDAAREDAEPPRAVPAHIAASPRAAAQPERAADNASDASAFVLRRLANNVQGYRLAGETGVSEWPIYLSDAQARGATRFELGYISAVAAMPEASSLTLIINDHVVGEAPARAAADVKAVSFDIPAGLLRPGFNSVRVASELRHRVDCSLDATYELWAQIDPTRTGLLLPRASAGVEQLGDIAALPPNALGALPIRAVLPAQARAGEVERALLAAQMIALAGRFEQPVIDVGPLAGGAYGANLVVGTAAKIAQDVDPAMLGSVTGPRAFVIPATASRRTTIIVTGTTTAEVDEAMKMLVASAPKGSPTGLRAAAAFPGYRVEGGTRVTLRDLGVTNAEFTGRLFRTAFNIVMPSDFYAADYDRATLRLAGGYSSGLAPGAQVVVSVNERTAVSLALPKSTGDVFKENPLPVPLGFLRPGLNRIEIEAHLPTLADGACDPLAAIHATNRFLFLDSTTFEMPALARVARMPDLAVTSSGGFPYTAAAHPKLFLGQGADPRTVGAAMTMAAHVGVAAGRPVDFEILTTPPGPGKGPTLAVAPIDKLDPALLKKFDLPGRELREAWSARLGIADGEPIRERIEAQEKVALQKNYPMVCHAPQASLLKQAFLDVDDEPTGSIRRAGDVEDPDRDLFAEWGERVRKEKAWSLIAWAEHARDWTVSKFTDGAKKVRAGLDAGEPNAFAAEHADLVLGQAMLGDQSDDVWTVVTAPTPSALAQGVACLVDPRVSRQISGRAAALDMEQAKIGAAPVVSSHFVATQPLSVGNARLIAAGWLSLHSFAYVAGALALALLVAVSTRLFVSNVGRRSK